MTNTHTGFGSNLALAAAATAALTGVLLAVLYMAEAISTDASAVIVFGSWLVLGGVLFHANSEPLLSGQSSRWLLTGMVCLLSSALCVAIAMLLAVTLFVNFGGRL